MLQLFPKAYSRFVCPVCKSDNQGPEKVIFQGIHVLADITCRHCNYKYLQDFPMGQAITTPAIIDKKALKLLSPAGTEWFFDPLLLSLRSQSDTDIRLERIINRSIEPGNSVIFINCLDAWYGHVLLKLFNIQFYHDLHPGLKKIVLIPKGFSWMVPAYADEIWIADLKLQDTKQYFLKLDEFISGELKKYNTVYLSSGYSHPDLQAIRVRDFFKTAPFDIKNFTDRPKKITLIYREDRLWIHPFLNAIFSSLNFRKITFANKLFLYLQARKFGKLVRKIKKAGIEAEFIACGPGKKVKLHPAIIDKRTDSITEQMELDWCSIYSQSQLVIGMHGSNMLIPSALSAGWIEILPNDRLGNITQDLFCKYSHSTMHFMGRFVSEYDPLSRVAQVATSIFNHFSSFHSQKPHDYI